MATEQEQIDLLRGDMIDVKTRLAVAESNIKETKEKLGKIDANTTWTMRIILTAVILAILDSVMKGGVL